MKRKNFAVIGKPISQSLSPVLFSKYVREFNDEFHYSRILLDDINEFTSIVNAFDIQGLNVTSPFKTGILELISNKSREVLSLGAANTIVFDNRDSFAYNTDIVGVKEPLVKAGISNNSSVLILGAGGAAKAVLLALKNIGINKIFISNRTSEKIEEFKNICSVNIVDFDEISNLKVDVIVNTIPVYLDVFEKLKIDNTTVVFDANYNNKPLENIAKSRKAKYIDGIEWLKVQGIESYFKMTGLNGETPSVGKDDMQKIKSKSKRIALIGPMGSWKSSVGIRLAEKLNFEFADIDNLVEKREKRSIKEIFESEGEDYFRKLENLVLQEVLKKENVIISTGGGIIKQEKNISLLKENSWNILLYASPKECFSRINIDKRPLLKGEDVLKILNDLFEERKGKYYYTSDLIINTEQKTSKIITDLLYEDYCKTFEC